MVARSIICLIFALLSTACATREVGPAERMGRGVDEIIRGAQQIDEENQKRAKSRQQLNDTVSADGEDDDNLYNDPYLGMDNN